jgi:hypothetical protein
MIAPKPWPVATFELHRPHLTNFVRTDILPLLEDEQCRRIILRAPVKCGKREMVEYIAMRDTIGEATRVHAFLSAWHRAADEDQRIELGKQNMKVFSITTQKKVTECMTWIGAQLARGKKVVLHLDECDHGSGAAQMLSKVWSQVRDNDSITNILYSATPQEVLFSGEVDDEEHREMMEQMIEGYNVEYTPPAGYCGPARFLDAGLVREAIPFFYKNGTAYELSPQGKEIVTNLRLSIATTPSRNIIVLRLSYADLGGKATDRKKNKSIHQFLANLASFPELAGFSVIVDKGEGSIRYAGVRSHKIEWSSRSYWEDLATGKPMLFVIDQTSSRSTEWACHDRIFATHDFRNIVQYSTISQAQERVNHYEQRYGGFQSIFVYGHTKTFQLSAGRIDYATYLKDEWKKRKIDVRRSPEEMYEVKGSRGLHPECPEAGLSIIAADRLLQKLGCYADVSVSARVAGKDREVRTYAATWRRVTKDTWDIAWPTIRDELNLTPAEGTRDTTRNPFVAAEAHKQGDVWLGQHRGWKVLEFTDGKLFHKTPTGLVAIDLGSTGGNRTKVCYSGGILGVAIVRCTGVRRLNTLHAFNSMYRT